MKTKQIIVSIRTLRTAFPLLAIAALWCGCSTSGQALLDPFPPGGNGAALPVERVSAGAGQIATAGVDKVSGGFEVHGLVRRRTFADPSPGAHIDVLLLDSHAQVLESVAVAYPPNEHPFRYSARLVTRKAPPGAMVKVVLHDADKSACVARSLRLTQWP